VALQDAGIITTLCLMPAVVYGTIWCRWFAAARARFLDDRQWNMVYSVQGNRHPPKYGRTICTTC